MVHSERACPLRAESGFLVINGAGGAIGRCARVHMSARHSVGDIRIRPATRLRQTRKMALSLHIYCFSGGRERGRKSGDGAVPDGDDAVVMSLPWHHGAIVRHECKIVP